MTHSKRTGSNKSETQDRIPCRVHPMLAVLASKPSNQPGWVYEEKYDGYRILAYKEGAKVTLLSRNDKDRTATYAGVANLVAELSPRTLLLDGEVVALDKNGISRFELLQQGAAKPRYAVFDCLYLNGQDLRRQPLRERRKALEKTVPTKTGLFVSRRLASNGLVAYEIAKKKGYEGVLAKDESSSYIEGRSSSWLKFKVHQEDEFVIVGYTPPEGSRKYIGALLLGAHQDGKLYYVGKVGTGFSQERLRSLHSRFKPLIRKSPPIANPPREPGVIYLKPDLVAQIGFQEWTDDKKLRQARFLGLRDDKAAREVSVPESAP